MNTNFEKILNTKHLVLSMLWRLLLTVVLIWIIRFVMDFPAMYQAETNRDELKKEHLIIRGYIYGVNNKYRTFYYSFVIAGKEYKGESSYYGWVSKHGGFPDDGDSVLVCYKKK